MSKETKITLIKQAIEDFSKPASEVLYNHRGLCHYFLYVHGVDFKSLIGARTFDKYAYKYGYAHWWPVRDKIFALQSYKKLSMYANRDKPDKNRVEFLKNLLKKRSLTMKITINGWLARQKNNALFFHSEIEKPKRRSNFFRFSPIFPHHQISTSFFPEITWENSPVRAKITIEVEDESND